MNTEPQRACIICGSRDWTDVARITSLVARLPAGTLIITGGQRGADTIAHEAALARWRSDGDIPEPVSIPADWAALGKAAGPVRNREMLRRILEYPQRCVFAFPLGGPGTDNMIRLARAASVTVRVASS